MICESCFSEHWERIFEYSVPDKYEKFCGLDYISREWWRCIECGHYQSVANYDIERLTPVYRDGYRSKEFRGRTIKEQFNHIINLPNNQRENYNRVQWINLSGYCKGGNLLDIGSGLGVFPFEMESIGYRPTCTELNKDSRKFIKNKLGFHCTDGDPSPCFFGKFGLMSMVHVLEHVKAPGLFLHAYRKYLANDGVLFIEVPDAVEFKILSKDHDEFNSCHFHFFTIPSLSAIVERSGYSIFKIESVFHNARGLSRIRLLARKS